MKILGDNYLDKQRFVSAIEAIKDKSNNIWNYIKG